MAARPAGQQGPAAAASVRQVCQAAGRDDDGPGVGERDPITLATSSYPRAELKLEDSAREPLENGVRVANVRVGVGVVGEGGMPGRSGWTATTAPARAPGT